MRQEKKSVQSSARLHVCGKPLTVLTVVVIMLTALSWSGCASHRKSVTMAKTTRTDSVVRLVQDSVSEFVEVKTKPLTIPKSEVSLTIATDSLRRLPSGASYSERSGQASVKVTREAATATEPEYIYVYATCDSLLLQCERYERTISTLRRDLAHFAESDSTRQALEQSERQSSSGWACLKGGIIGFLAGVFIGFILTVLLVIYIKKK